jgi:alkanesulfonate monooxygenase SsuD/methylene tetrahydromethanopterin reductase-like flavin-dependent oxidoreductase (luciferase family)
MMNFGINFFPSFRPQQMTAGAYFAQCVHVAEAADQLGFRSVKTVEHYFNDYGGSCPNPIVLLSAIAAEPNAFGSSPEP